MVSPGNISASNVIQAEHVVFRCLKYTVRAIKEKRGHGFEQGVHQRVWREERRQGRNIISKIKVIKRRDKMLVVTYNLIAETQPSYMVNVKSKVKDCFERLFNN